MYTVAKRCRERYNDFMQFYIVQFITKKKKNKKTALNKLYRPKSDRLTVTHHKKQKKKLKKQNNNISK